MPLRRLFERQGVEVEGLDFLVHVALEQGKTRAFRQARNKFAINPALAYACGDEKKDFMAATSCGMHPFMVSYGFEDYQRLTQKIGVPAEIVSRNPAELQARVFHALGIDQAE